MSYIVETEKVCAVLDAVARRSLLSKPVPCFYDPATTRQEAGFTPEEKLAVTEYAARYVSVLRGVSYQQVSPFGGTQQSAPLLTMLLHMLDSPSCGPSYVAENAQRLHDAMKSHEENFKAAEVSEVMRKMGAEPA